MKIPIKIIVKLEGEANATHFDLTGIYYMRSDKEYNGCPVWKKEASYEAEIWCDKNGTKWNIGTNSILLKERTSLIYSLVNGPLETNHWAYNNGSEFLFSDDIAVESGNNVIKLHTPIIINVTCL